MPSLVDLYKRRASLVLVINTTNTLNSQPFNYSNTTSLLC